MAFQESRFSTSTAPIGPVLGPSGALARTIAAIARCQVAVSNVTHGLQAKETSDGAWLGLERWLLDRMHVVRRAMEETLEQSQAQGHDELMRVLLCQHQSALLTREEAEAQVAEETPDVLELRRRVAEEERRLIQEKEELALEASQLAGQDTSQEAVEGEVAQTPGNSVQFEEGYWARDSLSMLPSSLGPSHAHQSWNTSLSPTAKVRRDALLLRQEAATAALEVLRAEAREHDAVLAQFAAELSGAIEEGRQREMEHGKAVEQVERARRALALLGNSLWEHNKHPAAAHATLMGAKAVLAGPSLDPEAYRRSREEARAEADMHFAAAEAVCQEQVAKMEAEAKRVEAQRDVVLQGLQKEIVELQARIVARGAEMEAALAQQAESCSQLLHSEESRISRELKALDTHRMGVREMLRAQTAAAQRRVEDLSRVAEANMRAQLLKAKRQMQHELAAAAAVSSSIIVQGQKAVQEAKQQRERYAKQAAQLRTGLQTHASRHTEYRQLTLPKVTDSWQKWAELLDSERGSQVLSSRPPSP